MATHDAQGRELFVCSQCKCRRIAVEYELDRHGLRRKGCIRCKAKREASKCPHGKRKLDCVTCSPEKFCEHGKCKNRHTCRVCDAAGNERRKHIRNAREFATQAGGWPFEHVRVNSENVYNAVVNKWKGVFAKMVEDGDIDESLHAQILANLKPPEKICEPKPSVASCLKRVVNAFVDRQVGGACLIASAAFIHLLGRGEIVEGYLGRQKAPVYCRHYWVCVDGVDFDIGSAITARLVPHIIQLGKPMLFRQPRPFCEQMDDPRALEVLERGYRTYQRSPSELLRDAPGWMRSEFGF